jgi:hypothetical protein
MNEYEFRIEEKFEKNLFIYIIHAGQIISSVVLQQNIYIHIVFLLRPFFKPTPSIINFNISIW